MSSSSDCNNEQTPLDQPTNADESKTTAGDPKSGKAASVSECEANLLLNLSSVPKKGEPITLHRNDILSGRGRGPNSHSGNVYYRSLIKSEKLAYVNGNPREKKLIITKILNKIMSMNPPGRFLKENSQNSDWEIVSPDEARKKTAQALRENAVKIRRSLQPGEMDYMAAAILPSLTSENRGKQRQNVQNITPPVSAPVPTMPPVSMWSKFPSQMEKPRQLPRVISQGGPPPPQPPQQQAPYPRPIGIIQDPMPGSEAQPPMDRKRRDPPGSHCDEIDVNWQKRQKFS